VLRFRLMAKRGPQYGLRHLRPIVYRRQLWARRRSASARLA
jgi:hypothetical protein